MEKYLPKCLDSLLDQDIDLTDYEIIVVNDESKDTTLQIANNYAKINSNIHVINKKNAGVGAARNSGFDLATGTYIYFIDPDDYLAKNVIGKLLSIIENNSLEILTFKSLPVTDEVHNISKNIETISDELNIKDGISYIATQNYKNEIWWYICNRSFMKGSGIRFIEGKWMEDAILTAELFCEAKRMAHINLDIHRYRILPTSAMRNKSPEHYNKIIFDNANATHHFDHLIKKIPENHKDAQGCITRLQTRQQSFVFFLLLRLMKSNLSVKEIPKMLSGFKTIGAYPINKFLGKDYHGFNYSFLVFVFNHKFLINPFFKLFRIFYKLIK